MNLENIKVRFFRCCLIVPFLLSIGSAFGIDGRTVAEITSDSSLPERSKVPIKYASNSVLAIQVFDNRVSPPKPFGILSAVLLEGNKILSAAHIIGQIADAEQVSISEAYTMYERNDYVAAAIFSDDLQESKASEKRWLTASRIHPKYLKGNFGRGTNEELRIDIALFHFDGEVPNGFSPANIGFHSDIRSNENLIVGYGQSLNGHWDGKKRYQLVPGKEFAELSSGVVITKSRITAPGDSGGPLFVLDNHGGENVYLLSAIASSITKTGSTSIYLSILSAQPFLERAYSELMPKGARNVFSLPPTAVR